MAAPPSAKDVLADEAKFNAMTEAAFNKAGGGDKIDKKAIKDAAFNKAGGGDKIDKKAIKDAMEALGKEKGLAAPSAEFMAKFENAAKAIGVTKEGSLSLDEFRAEFKAILTKAAESE